MNFVLLVGAVVLVATQRLFELRVSRRNERRLRARGAVEFGSGHYPVMVGLHSAWLASTLVEGVWRGISVPSWWVAPLLLFLLAQIVRYWAISTLGDRWNTRILVVPGERLVRRGPYKYLSHPNYVVVIVEILCFPLVFGAWMTALVFSVANGALLFVRIREEDRALSEVAKGRGSG
ncbi:MAG: hypothetical protein H0U65_04125 [Rubrobacter sp.]|nr:hypothetical protein [Rubrobacter sp.]